MALTAAKIDTVVPLTMLSVQIGFSSEFVWKLM